MSIPQKEVRKLKRDLKDNARDRVFKDIQKMIDEMPSDAGSQSLTEEEFEKLRNEQFAKIRDLVDTYAKVETTVLTRERMNEAWARMKKNA